jgi:hypothetical protein
VVTTAPISKVKVKPSLQTQFMLDAMEVKAKESEKWEKMQESIDLIFTKLDS